MCKYVDWVWESGTVQLVVWKMYIVIPSDPSGIHSTFLGANDISGACLIERYVDTNTVHVSNNLLFKAVRPSSLSISPKE